MKPKFKYSREMYTPKVDIKFLETDEYGNQIYEYSVNGNTYRYSIPAATYASVTYITAPYLPAYNSTYVTYNGITSTTMTTNTYSL